MDRGIFFESRGETPGGHMKASEPRLVVTRIVRFEGTGAVRAYCDLAIGDLFTIRGLRVVEGKNGRFVSMPRQMGKNQKWYDMVELAKELKNEVDRIVLEAYDSGVGAVAEESVASVA
jgi:stage V sporulation protein G